MQISVFENLQTSPLPRRPESHPQTTSPRGSLGATLVLIAGQVSITSDESVTGKLGHELTIEEGYAAARLCGLNILAQLKACVGDDIDYSKAIKLGGFVNAQPDFTNPPAVINGASDLLIAVMGDAAGKHARFAVAVNSLPGGAAVEVDAIFEIGL